MKIQSPVIPPGSIVVVLGANGYIAQETCHKLLEAGYRVRGTVRDIVRNAWVCDLFETKFSGMFELVQVVDFGAEGAFDEAFKGASGVIYVSVPVVFSPDPAIAVTPIMNTVLNALSATAKAGITRFVLNSSSKAVETTVYNTPHTIKSDTFNPAEIARALNEPTVSTPERALTVYSAGRTSAELAFWDWVGENKEKYPDFVANCVVPDGNFGRVLEPGRTGTGPATSVGMLQRALRGVKEGVMPFVGYLIDTQDTARLLVAALVLPDISNERIFAFYKHYTWNELRQRVRELYPDRDDLVLGDDYDDFGRDMGDADELISRAEEILRQTGQDGFSSVDDLLKDYIESFYLKTL
ncbi:NAD(P)-binding protein [Aspergillus stella-maris]|uniref:NAD(P)-binding protein n=1 Tax=Aspergillus stella-maris TaxID=1810926 RepID=UPI003CCD75F3